MTRGWPKTTLCSIPEGSRWRETAKGTIPPRVLTLFPEALWTGRATLADVGSGTEKSRHLATARVRGVLHPAVPFEDHAFIDDEDGCLNIADNPPRCVNFDLSACHDITADLATDDNMRDLDIGFDDGRLSNDEGPFGRNLTPEMTVDSDGSAEGQLPCEFRIVS